MIALLVFSALAALAVYLHFTMSHTQLEQLVSDRNGDLDPQHARMEDSFGQSFRHKVDEWLHLPEAADSTPQLRTIDKGSERIMAMGPAECPSRRLSQSVLVIRGDFRAGSGCHFTKEIYVAGDCTIGESTRLQALAVDGRLELEPKVTVRRWVDAEGAVTLGRDVRIESRVTSRVSVAMAPGSRALSIFAPEISTMMRTDAANDGYRRPANALTIPAAGGAAPKRAVGGFNPKLLKRTGKGGWEYNGDLLLEVPLVLQGKLIVRGNCVLARGSSLEAALKATGSVRVGMASVCGAAVEAEGNLVVESDVLFQSTLHAGHDLVLQAGVRGRGQQAVVASAGQSLLVDPNVVVRGKLAAGQHVVAVPPGYVTRG